ncbi:YdcF family protein [Aerococcus sanguinicola]|uniref:YdcF family protein n=1 Tax=unclassified Aerococcus TaxID=2618060 RepID=UPI0008A4605E|nr:MULTISPECIES: YdcF family protein [unclassified Aerococcus]KAB0646272.1 YdcF family protein [Aerococcus sanguinicola]MDK6233105.1 YdcF family protein [Aerococcus sp. UMB10185]MDK6804777.1 YdcF family protein [Aerococcus sp. UMB7834]MDK6855689.1 YdcF family protein [Aerococcus sp. UMB7533]OFN00168.1 hypothetical protein HMPREF2626_09860 [Aerococcus sp. HMSC062A02]
MIIYGIAFALIAVALVIFILAPRNVWDNLILILGLVCLFLAVINDQNFPRYYWVHQVFRWAQVLTDYIAPLLLMIFGVCMFSLALNLFTKEHSYSQLLVGLFLSVLLIGISIAHYWLIFTVELSDKQDWLRIPDFVMAYYVLLFINYLLMSARLSFLESQKAQDYVIVLGASLRPDGSPSGVLERRLNRTLSYLNWHTYIHGKQPMTIVSGGLTGPKASYTEAEVMRDYLLARGLSADKILLEDQASNTHGNFYYSKCLIQDRQPIIEAVSAVFVTSSYHLYRSQLYANLEKLYQVSGIGAPSTLKEWTIDSFREYIAILFMHRRLHFIVSLALLGFGIINFVHF